jgi:ATP-binding cassette, subfamily B, bacterial PglK
MVAKKVWNFFNRPEKKQAALLFFLMVVGMLLETLGISLIIPTISIISQPDIISSNPLIQPILEELGSPDHITIVMGFMIGLVIVYLFKNLFLSFLAWRQTCFSYRIISQISEQLLSTYLHQPYKFHLHRNSSQLIRNTVMDVNLFGFNFLVPFLSLLTESLVMIGLITLLLVVEPLGTLIVIIVMGVVGGGFYLSTRNLLIKYGTIRQKYDGLRIQNIQEALGGIKDIKLLGRETGFLNQYHSHNNHWVFAGRLQQILQRLPAYFMEQVAITGLAVVVLTMLYQGRSINELLPAIGLFAAVAFRLMPSANRILSSLQAMRFGFPVIYTLHEELHLGVPTQLQHTTVHNNPNHFQNNISLSNIIFTYDGTSDPALNDISLSIQQGESVGFIGSSGSGKSTLIDTILGLFTPDSGNVTVDGEDIQNDLRKWQNQIGYVPQSIFLTDDTLRRNVAFGLPDEQIDEINTWRAIQSAQLEDFVKGLSQGLDTIVGERGVRLSGGQRQRIGIARALYNDPSVLVLDEATSSLDTSTEIEVMQAVNALQGSKTILIVAHRLSTVYQCDRLYRLENGKMLEEHHPKVKSQH